MFLASLKERWGLFQIIYNTDVTDLILFIGDVHIQTGFKSAVCREELGLQQQRQPQCCHLVAFFSLKVSRTINCRYCDLIHLAVKPQHSKVFFLEPEVSSVWTEETEEVEC